MKSSEYKYYPTILGAIHLVILYIFIQTLVDFPLAIIDYYHDTEYLYNPLKKIILGVGSIAFILYFGYRQAGTELKTLFPVKRFNPLILIPVLTFLWGSQHLIDPANRWIDKLIPPPAWFWEMFNKVFESDFGIYGAILKVVIVAPIIEELIFRGVIMHGLMRNYSKPVAIFFSGLLFALFHLNPWQFPATFVLGMLLGWLMIRTRNILACIAGHAINNGLVMIYIQYQTEISSSFFYTGMGKPWQYLVCVLVMIGSIALVVFLSKGKNNEVPR